MSNFGRAKNIPIVGNNGDENQPVVLDVKVVITQALRKKLMEWSDKTGIQFNQIASLIVVHGVMEVSMILDDDDEREELERSFFGGPQGPTPNQ